LDQKIYRAATEAARRKFSPEFMNRIDKVIVFRALTREHLEKILDIELARVQQRIINATDGRQFVFRCTTTARDFLLREGTDIKFGARHLKRSIERHLVFPISNLLATEQIQLGDLITVDFDAVIGKLVFVKEDQGALVHSEEETTQETALVPVSVRTAGASRALARRASREA
jgi:ATP-dependent Clp protease ATP-binding subunit ClpA